MLESKTSSGDPVPAPQDPISVSLDILSSLPRTPLTAGPLTLDLPLLLSRHKRAYTQSSDHLLSPAPLGCAGAVQALKNYAVDGGYPGDNEEGLDQYMTDSMDEARKLWVEKGYGEAAGEGDLRDAMIGAAQTAVDVFYRSQNEGRKGGLLGFARELENAEEGEEHMEAEM